MMFLRFRAQMPTLIGAALLILAVDSFILVYRLVGLSRPIAVYAGLLTFLSLGAVVAQRFFRPCKSEETGPDENA